MWPTTFHVLTAGHCLFAGPNRYGPQSEAGAPTVFRQKDARAAHSNYGAATRFPLPMPNVYHNILAYGDREKEYTFEECDAQKFPVHDVERPMPQSPWESSDPFGILRVDSMTDPLKVDAKKAFAPNRNLPELRVPGDPDGRMLGTRFVGREQLYADRLSPPGKPDRDATVKVWDPAATEDTPGVFKTLKKAIADVQKGDTLLIRHTGELAVDPVVISGTSRSRSGRTRTSSRSSSRPPRRC